MSTVFIRIAALLNEIAPRKGNNIKFRGFRAATTTIRNRRLAVDSPVAKACSALLSFDPLNETPWSLARQTRQAIECPGRQLDWAKTAVFFSSCCINWMVGSDIRALSGRLHFFTNTFEGIN